MSATAWVALGGAVWTALSIGLGVVIGRTVKRRDAQRPLDPKVVTALAESIRNHPTSGPRRSAS